MNLTIEECKLVAKVARSYPPGNGGNWLCIKLKTPDDPTPDSTMSVASGLKDRFSELIGYGWPAVRLAAVRCNNFEGMNTDRIFNALHNALEDIAVDYFLGEYCDALDKSPSSIADFFEQYTKSVTEES